MTLDSHEPQPCPQDQWVMHETARCSDRTDHRLFLVVYFPRSVIANIRAADHKTVDGKLKLDLGVAGRVRVPLQVASVDQVIAHVYDSTQVNWRIQACHSASMRLLVLRTYFGGGSHQAVAINRCLSVCTCLPVGRTKSTDPIQTYTSINRAGPTQPYPSAALTGRSSRHQIPLT